MVDMSKFIVNCGSLIDGIQFLLTDGIKSTYSPHFGGMGGGFYEWIVPPKERVSQVEYWV
jgi:hypothetical protein